MSGLIHGESKSTMIIMPVPSSDHRARMIFESLGTVTVTVTDDGHECEILRRLAVRLTGSASAGALALALTGISVTCITISSWHWHDPSRTRMMIRPPQLSDMALSRSEAAAAAQAAQTHTGKSRPCPVTWTGTRPSDC